MFVAQVASGGPLTVAPDREIADRVGIIQVRFMAWPFIKGELVAWWWWHHSAREPAHPFNRTSCSDSSNAP